MDKNISVRIFGKTYQLRSVGGIKIEQLAALVDSKMCDLSKAKSTQSTQDLAVLTALNFAEELKQEKESSKTERGSIRKKAEDLIFKLSDEIESLKK